MCLELRKSDSCCCCCSRVPQIYRGKLDRRELEKKASGGASKKGKKGKK